MNDPYEEIWEVRDLIKTFSGDNAEEVSLSISCLNPNCYGDVLYKKKDKKVFINGENVLMSPDGKRKVMGKLKVASRDGIRESTVNVYSEIHTLPLMCILQSKRYQVDLLWEKE